MDIMTKKKKSTTPKEPQTKASDVDPFAAYLGVGRVNQKLRTRDSLVSVAADYIRKGQTISVAEVADAARVSRTTAYRYFPTSELLSVQATLVAASTIEATQIMDNIARGSGTPAEKLDAVIVASDAMTHAHEAAYRSLVRHTVETGHKSDKGLPRRRGFRRFWLQAALADIKTDLGLARFDQLTAALCLLCGIEPFIVLRDICMLKPDAALEVKRWVAQQLLRSAESEAQSAKLQSKQKKT
jgi:AcrR family transcriptional regulator